MPSTTSRPPETETPAPTKKKKRLSVEDVDFLLYLLVFLVGITLCWWRVTHWKP